MVDGSKGKSSDLTWDHCEKIQDGGIYRIKQHLAHTRKDVAPCSKVSDEIRDLFKSLLNENKKNKDGDDFHDESDIDGNKKVMANALGKGMQKSNIITLNSMWKKDTRESVCRDISRFLYANALSFNLVKDPYFKTMLDKVDSFGPGLKPPSYHEVRSTFLKKEVDTITTELLEKYRSEWKKTGCTLMSDGWTDGKNRSITNFLVNSPRGTVFLRSVDTSGIYKSADNLFELLDSVIDEIGKDNVVQVVTDSASAYVKAGEMLMDKHKQLFWSPCAAHCLDLILSDIGDMSLHSDIVSKARKVTVYIYRHSWVLNLMRKYTKGRELIRAGVTRFATSYLTLRSLIENKIGLRAMFGSEDWQRSNYAKKTDEAVVMKIILADSNFWSSIKYCLKCVIPLVKVLRLVDGDARPAMGYIYETIDRAKEQIEKNFNNIQRNYKPIWDIIDKRWAMQLHMPLHAAAYYLKKATI